MGWLPKPEDPSVSARRRALVMALVGLAIGSGLALRNLVPVRFDPSVLIRVGEQQQEYVDYARARLGHLVLSPKAGHDGKFFFVQAMDPLLLHPDLNARLLDRPTYRAQRMLYPLLAGGAGLFPARATAWGLVTVNVLALALGTWATARLARLMGVSEWFGLAFALNPGMIVELNIDGSGILALALGMLGVSYFEEDRRWPAVAALAAAALARETMLLFAVGLAVYEFARRRRLDARWLVPFAGVGLWALWIRVRLGSGLGEDTQALDLPLRGLVRAVTPWLHRPDGVVDLLMAVLLLAMGLLLVVETVRHPTALGAATLGFVVLGLFLSQAVWDRYFDSSRALAPVITGYLVVAAAGLRGRTPASVRRDVSA